MVERIKRAMELARQERQSAAPAMAATDAARVAMVPEALGRGVLAAAPPNDDIRTVKVSEHTLQEGRLLLPGLVGKAGHGFRLLRTQVLQRLRQRGWNTLAVLSPGPDEGKTFTAINLAIAITADRDSTALVVDLDLRFPRLRRRLDFRPTVGIEGCLRGQATLQEVMVRIEGYPGLTVLPAVGPVENSSELISGASARALFRKIKERDPNRIVIYDLPPVLATDDALSFLPQVDAALMVIGDGLTRREDLIRCMGLLRDTPILGTVLNGSRVERSAEYAY